MGVAGANLDLPVALRLGYLGAASGILIVTVIPAFRRRFLSYGARSSTVAPNGSRDKHVDGTEPYPRISHAANVVLDQIAAFRVPHSWFTSFYVMSVASSLMWACVIPMKGLAFQTVASLSQRPAPSMSVPQIHATWILMATQGSRRLYECLTLSRPSKSQMWIGHWVSGVAFYLATGLAIWVEGISALSHHQYSLRDLTFVGPSLSTVAATLIFILASGFQHDCHVYLASLKNSGARGKKVPAESQYHLPTHPAFVSLICPHYTAECMIYLSLAVIAAPEGQWANRTMLSALVFVVVNLGVTAHMTKIWYEEKFGIEAVDRKWRMIPFIF